MVIEVSRDLLIREPWTTASIGGTKTRPMVVSLTNEPGLGANLVEKLNATPAGVQTFRVVDGAGPCYEFQGTALMKDDLVTVHVAGALTFLR
jgi:hypothetical protein